MDTRQIIEQAKDVRHAAEDVIELVNNLQFAAEEENYAEVKKVAVAVNNFFFTLRRQMEQLQIIVKEG